MKTTFRLMCSVILVAVAAKHGLAGPMPTRVTSVYDVTGSEVDLFGGSITADTLIGAVKDLLYPWRHKLDKIREANEARGIAGHVGRFLEVGYTPHPDDPDPDPWPWAELKKFIPDPHPNWVNLNAWGSEAVGYWVDPPSGPSPIDPWAAHDLLESMTIIPEAEGLKLRPGQFGLLRSRLALEPGAIQQISQESGMVLQGYPGDGVVMGGVMDMLLFDPEQQGYKTLMTAELGSYVLQVAGPGDPDGSGDADGKDFLLLQRGFGSAFDGNDLQQWSAAYGQAAPGLANLANVPEPASLALLSLSALTILLGRRRR